MKTKQVVYVGIYSATLFAIQIALSSLPNVELVSFLFVIYGLSLSFKMNLAISFVFVTLEVIAWGFGDWAIGYYWIWPLWALLIHLIKPLLKEDAYKWALFIGLWGILFGLLFAINHGLFYGFHYSLAYWIKGLSFDLIHVISNYIIMLILFNPVLKLFKENHQK